MNILGIRLKTIRIRHSLRQRKRDAVQADGGPGSGNFGHEGRKGEVGGSAPNGGGSDSSSTKAYMSLGRNPSESHIRNEWNMVLKDGGGNIWYRGRDELANYYIHDRPDGDIDAVDIDDEDDDRLKDATIVSMKGFKEPKPEYNIGKAPTQELLEKNLPDIELKNKDGDTFTNYDEDSYVNLRTGELIDKETAMNECTVERVGGITKEVEQLSKETGIRIDESFAQVDPEVTGHFVESYKKAAEFFPELKDEEFKVSFGDTGNAAAYVMSEDKKSMEYRAGPDFLDAKGATDLYVQNENYQPNSDGTPWLVKVPEGKEIDAFCTHEIGHLIFNYMQSCFNHFEYGVSDYRMFMSEYFPRLAENLEGHSVYSTRNADEQIAEGISAHLCGSKTPFADMTGKIVTGWRKVFGNISSEEELQKVLDDPNLFKKLLK